MHFTVPQQVNDSDLSHGAASLPAYQAEPAGTAATSDELLVTGPTPHQPALFGEMDLCSPVARFRAIVPPLGVGAATTSDPRTGSDFRADLHRASVPASPGGAVERL